MHLKLDLGVEESAAHTGNGSRAGARTAGKGLARAAFPDSELAFRAADCRKPTFTRSGKAG